MTENPRGDEAARRAYEALQRLRGLDPWQPPTEPVAELAWLLETNGGRRHPLDVVASGSIHPMLKRRGFRRKGRTWNRRVGGLVHVINVQSSRFNVLTQRSPCFFYVNVGVLVPEVRELVQREPAPDFAQAPQCQVRHRLNHLLGDPSMLVMALDPDQTLEQQGEQLARQIVDVAVSYLDRFTSLEALYAVVRAEAEVPGRVDQWLLAYAGATLGDTVGAEAALQALAARVGRNSASRRQITRVASALNLTVTLPVVRPAATAGDPQPAAVSGEVSSEPIEAEPPLMTVQYRAAPWRLILADCAGLHDAQDVQRAVEQMRDLGLAPSLGPWEWQGGTPQAVEDVPAWMEHVHQEGDVWKRWKDSTRKLARSRVSETWGSAAIRPDRGWYASVGVSRYGRDNWHLFVSASQWEHGNAGVPFEEYAESWAELFVRVATELRPRLQPKLAILYASESYDEVLEDLERGALLVGWRTWYGPALVERFGRGFLLGLPDQSVALPDGTIAHEMALPAPAMVLPTRGKFTALRRYLDGRDVQLAWPRL